MDSYKNNNNPLARLAGLLSLSVLLLSGLSVLQAQELSQKSDKLNGSGRRAILGSDRELQVVPDDSVSPWEAVQRLQELAPEIFSYGDRALMETAVKQAVLPKPEEKWPKKIGNKSSQGSGRVGGSKGPAGYFPLPESEESRCDMLKQGAAKTSGSQTGSAGFELGETAGGSCGTEKDAKSTGSQYGSEGFAQDDTGRPGCGTETDGPRKGDYPGKFSGKGASQLGGKINAADPATTLRIEPQIMESNRFGLRVIDADGFPARRLLAGGPGDRSYVIHVQSTGKALGLVTLAMIPLTEEPTLEGFKTVVVMKVPGDIFTPFTVPQQHHHGGNSGGRWLITATTSDGDFAVKLVEVLP
jgi:hypothetical protein